MKLYYFTKFEHAIDNIRKNRIKISKIDDVNDPFEYTGIAIESDYEETMFEDIKTQVAKKYGLICLSAGNSNPLMWSHYANHHKGVCLGIEIDNKLFSDGSLKKVSYDRKKFNLIKLSDYSEKSHHIYDKLFNDIVLSTKSADWSYEEEYRLHANLESKDGDHYFFDMNSSVKYVDVIFGLNCEEKIGDFLDEFKDKNFNLFLAQKNRQLFEMSIIEINAES